MADEEVSVSAASTAAVGALIDAHRDLLPVLEEHFIDNEGEVSPHPVLGDVIRWLIVHRDSHPRVVDRVSTGWRTNMRGPQEVRGLIIVSGAEMIPDPGMQGAELRELLGPELRRVDPWLTR